MSAPALEAWPELGEFLRQLVRHEVDAQKTATTDGLVAFIRKAVATEVSTAMDGMMDEILATIADGAPPVRKAPAATPAAKPAPGRPKDDWLTTKRAARIAGVRPKTINHWARTGTLTRYGTRQRVLVSRTELDALLARGPRIPRPRAMNGHAR